MDLDPTAVAAGVSLVTLDAVSSTNVEALARARSDERGPLWIVAHQQTGGRGRRGRMWVSPGGNLYATLLVGNPSPPANVAQLSFVTALAVHDAVADVAPILGPRLSLKWPNDALCDGKKFCGILLEGEGTRDAVVAVGIGINCAHHPADTTYPATDLTAAGAYVTPAAVFRALSRTMLLRIAQWNRSAGFASIRMDWLKRAEGLGKPIRARLHDYEMNGLFETIDDAGHLVLQRPDGAKETVAAGDVFPLHRARTEHA
jgi:BirA family biotin operon repressor/biotin-[acetyl-CoA-carboxylase] ligase